MPGFALLLLAAPKRVGAEIHEGRAKDGETADAEGRHDAGGAGQSATRVGVRGHHAAKNEEVSAGLS